MSREYRVYVTETRGRWVTVDAHDAEEAAERAIDTARVDIAFERSKSPFDWEFIELEVVNDNDVVQA